MKRNSILIAIAVLAVGLKVPGLVAGNRAFAGGTAPQPFNATYLIPPTTTHDGYYWVWPGTGTGTFVGNSSYLVSAHIAGKKAVGIVAITAANGDSLYLEATQTLVDAQTWTWVGPFTILGGTGRFANATGGGTVTSMAADTQGTEIDIYDGTISL